MQQVFYKDIILNIVILTFISAFVGIDVVHDMAEGLPARHYWHELVMVGFCLIWICYQLSVVIRKRQKVERLNLELSKVSTERDYYLHKISSIKADFQETVDNQFNLWGLSSGEKDIALLLIKGLSMKEIAQLRSSNESTVRQQSLSIYKKSQLSNRQHLAAFFLDDLF